MSNFINFAITSHGGELVRSARAASKKIVFVDAISGTHYENNRADLCWKDESFYDGAHGTVAAVVLEDGVLKVVASFTTASSAQPVKSVAIRAKIADADDSSAVLFAACSDDNTCIVLPSSGDNVTDVVFDIPMNLTSSDIDAFGELPSVGVDLSDYAKTNTEQTFTAGINFEITEGEGEEAVTHEYPFETNVVKVTYTADASTGTLDLTLGNGHVVRITGNVSVDPS